MSGNTLLAAGIITIIRSQVRIRLKTTTVSASVVRRSVREVVTRALFNLVTPSKSSTTNSSANRCQTKLVRRSNARRHQTCARSRKFRSICKEACRDLPWVVGAFQLKTRCDIASQCVTKTFAKSALTVRISDLEMIIRTQERISEARHHEWRVNIADHRLSSDTIDRSRLSQCCLGWPVYCALLMFRHLLSSFDFFCRKKNRLVICNVIEYF